MDALPILNEQTENVILLFTGPLTDLAKALQEDPSITKRIERLVWMGGTFLPKGNVEEPEHDGTAEWNAFWDPEAVKIVFDSDIQIDMVALESTNQVPLTLDVRQRWANERQYPGVDFLGVSYAAVPPLTHFITNSTYFLWDVLTTAYIGMPDLVYSVEKTVDVMSHGPSQGKTYECANGRKVNVIDSVDNKAFFDYITTLAKKVD